MKKTRLLLFISPLLLLIAGCQTHSRRPEWVDHPQKIYPESDYLVAIGEGNSRQSAGNAADAQLARIFETRIQSDERLLESSQETLHSFQRNSDLSSDILIQSNQTLFNIQHGESWTDKQGRVYLLAYLDRRETAQIYREKISKNDEQIHRFVQRAENTPDALEKYALLRMAQQHAITNRYLLRQLRTIHSPSADALSFAKSYASIDQALSIAAEQIHVVVQMEGKDATPLRHSLESLFSQYGFVLGSPATLKVKGTLQTQPLPYTANGLVFIRYRLDVQVFDSKNRLLFSFTEKGREGHLSASEARTRAIRTLETALSTQGKKQIDRYLDQRASARTD